jgi:hypothetical protein
LKVTLAFRKANKTWLSKLVAWLTHSKYDHSEIIIGTVWVGAHFKGGVTTRRVTTPLHRDWDYIDVPINPKFNHKAVLFINAVRGNKYDYLGAIVGEGLNLPPFNHKNKYFCSELVTNIMQQFDSAEVKGINPVSISPQELYDLYKGHLTKW